MSNDRDNIGRYRWQQIWTFFSWARYKEGNLFPKWMIKRKMAVLILALIHSANIRVFLLEAVANSTAWESKFFFLSTIKFYRLITSMIILELTPPPPPPPSSFVKWSYTRISGSHRFRRCKKGWLVRPDRRHTQGIEWQERKRQGAGQQADAAHVLNLRPKIY